jgi:hypothetical protein
MDSAGSSDRLLRFRPMRATALLVFCFACPADLSRYAIEGEDGDGSVTRVDAGPRPDGATVDGAIRDGGSTDDGCGPTPTCADGCPMPWLLASVEDLQPGDACSGRVLRWSLSTREDTCVCPSLTGDGALELPFAVGFVPPATVVAVEQDGSIHAIDPATDRERWVIPSTGSEGLPADVFPLADPSGAVFAAVASLSRGSSSINQVVVYDDAGAERRRWQAGTVPGGAGLSSITVSSFESDRYRGLKPNGGFAAAEIDPWTGTVSSSPYHTLSREGFFLRTISAFFHDGTHRTVWTGTRTDLAEIRSEVYTARSTIPREDNRVPLGDRCVENEEALDYDATCTFVHAVPHPLHDTDSFAICEVAAGQRRIVRLRHIDLTCIDLVEDTELFPRARFSKLAIALPSYWD